VPKFLRSPLAAGILIGALISAGILGLRGLGIFESLELPLTDEVLVQKWGHTKMEQKWSQACLIDLLALCPLLSFSQSFSTSLRSSLFSENSSANFIIPLLNAAGSCRNNLAVSWLVKPPDFARNPSHYPLRLGILSPPSALQRDRRRKVEIFANRLFNLRPRQCNGAGGLEVGDSLFNGFDKLFITEIGLLHDLVQLVPVPQLEPIPDKASIGRNGLGWPFGEQGKNLVHRNPFRPCSCQVSCMAAPWVPIGILGELTADRI